MSVRITECRGIAEPAARDCVETTSTVTTVAPCTVASDACSLTTGDAGVKATGPEKEEAEEDASEDCCCCEC